MQSFGHTSKGKEIENTEKSIKKKIQTRLFRPLITIPSSKKNSFIFEDPIDDEDSVIMIVKQPKAAKGHSANAIKERQIKNEMCFQAAVSLALLHPFCGFTIRRPIKASTATNSMSLVTHIHYRSDTIDLLQLSSTCCNLLYSKTEENSLKSIAIRRRMNKSVIFFILNYLLDLLREFGFFFDSIYAKKTCKTLQQERVIRIYFNNKLLFSKDEIQRYGKVINDYLFHLADKQTSAYVDKNDLKFEQYMEANIPSFYQKLESLFR
ncbi:hypothetical protein ENUP19_0252G0096 [Entamoeba nuttalli]|uniref:Uncharacterized protein n=2 Tax=Entamoeba nuttalli TaxID=412467 RepID=K2GZC7_ENTNP|nr:hypothetical protein ENU1_086240 [Entamoeba nuttalli P19]EKE40568.1 hypothetical protein ENU1_086240 [Entamoeba nuttalli P19]|eukprot:XP_008857094.1 hypothetical protein ENU1_086240 [Entamoeba nuttalli P19]